MRILFGLILVEMGCGVVGGGYYLLSAHGSHGNANGDKLFSLYRAKCLEQELQKLHYTFAVLKLLGSYRQTM